MRLVALAAVLVLTGCAGATHTLAPAADAERLAWANRLFGDQPAVVVLADGTARDADGLRIAPDTTTWVDPVTHDLRAVPTATVAQVDRRDPKRASRRLAGRGALVGAAAGVVLGAVGGYEFAEACFFTCPQPTTAEREGSAAAFSVAGALSGAFFGTFGAAVTGMFSEKTERFIFLPGMGRSVLETPANGGSGPNRAP